MGDASGEDALNADYVLTALDSQRRPVGERVSSRTLARFRDGPSVSRTFATPYHRHALLRAR